MFAKLRVMGVFALISTLTACGGGGGSGSNSSSGTTFTPADANAAYTGERNKALLTQQNGMSFVQVLLNTDPSGQIIFNTGASARAVNNIQAQQTSAKLVQYMKMSTLPKTYTTSAKTSQRTVGDSAPCTEGGTLSYSGDVNENDYTGVLSYRLSNCRLDGVTLSGIMQVRINEYDFNYDQPKSADISFDNLTMTYVGQTYTAVGTQTYSHGAYPALSTITSNITETAPDGDQIYSKNLTHKVDTDGLLDSYSGSIYLKDNGYVVISTPEKISELNGSMEQGEITLSGAAASKIKITPFKTDNYTYKTRADLDADGDGSYEFIAIQDRLYDWTYSNGFDLNKPPEVKIKHYIFKYLDANYTLNDGLKIKDTLSLYHTVSDPEGAGIKSVSWMIESNPNNSKAQIEPSNYDDTWEFNPRIPGDYSISLKAEDIDGNIGIDYLNFSVLENTPPTFDAKFGDQQLESNQPYQVGSSPIIYLDNVRDPDGDSYFLEYNWEILYKPSESKAEFTSDFSSEPNYNQYMPNVSFDVSGEYGFRVTVTDELDGKTQFYFSLNVSGRKKIIFESESFISDPVIFLRANYGPEGAFGFVTYEWNIISKPDNSRLVEPLFSQDEWAYSNMTCSADVDGTYVFSVTARDTYGREESATFSVVKSGL